MHRYIPDIGLGAANEYKPYWTPEHLKIWKRILENCLLPVAHGTNVSRFPNVETVTFGIKRLSVRDKPIQESTEQIFFSPRVSVSLMLSFSCWDHLAHRRLAACPVIDWGRVSPPCTESIGWRAGRERPCCRVGHSSPMSACLLFQGHRSLIWPCGKIEGYVGSILIPRTITTCGVLSSYRLIVCRILLIVSRRPLPCPWRSRLRKM